MRLPRMTTRRWMTVVVGVGLLMGAIVGGSRFWQRQSRLLAQAQRHAQIADLYAKQESDARQESAWLPQQITCLEGRRRDGSPVGGILDGLKVQLDRARKDVACLPDKIAYHATMARRYRYAARRPWLPVEMDSPELGP